MVWGPKNLRLSLGKEGNKRNLGLLSKKNLQTADTIKIGDKIRLTDSPWKDCPGMYSCKAARRPAFMEVAILEGAGKAAYRALSRSSTQFIMVVDGYVIEFTKLNATTGRVVYAAMVDDLFKMRLRRKEMIALFFKVGLQDPLVYACVESAEISDQIRAVKGSGLEQREAIHRALHLIQQIQAQERALVYQPSVLRVHTTKTLYEEAAQQFQKAGDAREGEVLTHMQHFMALPLVVSLLDGSFEPDGYEAKRKTEDGGFDPDGYEAKRKTEPEIFENSITQLEDDEISALSEPWTFDHEEEDEKESQSWACFDKEEERGEKIAEKPLDESTDEIEAREDFETSNVKGKNIVRRDSGRVDSTDGEEWANLDVVGSSSRANLYEIGSSSGEVFADFGRISSGDTFADIEAMMSEVDRELDEIMKMY